jgi:hypothetical protein
MTVKRAKWSVIDTHEKDAVVSEHATREDAIAACPRTPEGRYVAACPWDSAKWLSRAREPFETDLCS